MNWRMTVLNVITRTFLLSTSLMEEGRHFKRRLRGLTDTSYMYKVFEPRQ